MVVSFTIVGTLVPLTESGNESIIESQYLLSSVLSNIAAVSAKMATCFSKCCGRPSMLDFISLRSRRSSCSLSDGPEISLYSWTGLESEFLWSKQSGPETTLYSHQIYLYCGGGRSNLGMAFFLNFATAAQAEFENWWVSASTYFLSFLQKLYPSFPLWAVNGLIQVLAANLPQSILICSQSSLGM